MNKATYLVSFVCGAALGAVAMMLYAKKKVNHGETEQEETDEFEENDNEIIYIEDAPEESMAETVKIKEVVEDIIQKNGYSVGDHTNTGVDDGPYVIAPDDFGDFEDYDPISLVLTSDGVLLDDAGHVIDDPENNVGTEYKKYFGVYPDDPDSVYIRNDELCCDFEIVKDLRTHEEIDSYLPHMRFNAEVQ